MLKAKVTPSILFVLGSIDWLTTIIGIAYFGAVEGNPLIASLADSNLAFFTLLKLGTAFFVAFLFYQLEKTLINSGDKDRNCSKRRVYLFRSIQVATVAVLMGAAVNNMLVIVAAMA